MVNRRDIIQAVYQKVGQVRADAYLAYQQYQAYIQSESEKSRAMLAKTDLSPDAITQAYEAKVNEIQSRAHGLFDRLGAVAYDWDNPNWMSFIKSPVMTNPDDICVGFIETDYDALGIEKIPVLVPLFKSHILLVSEGKAKVWARQLLRSMMIRLVATLPAQTATFTFFDPYGAGANFVFDKLPASVRGERVLTKPDELNETLGNMTADMSASNTDDGAYQILGLADFPSRINADSAKFVYQIAQTGMTAHKMIIAHVDADIAFPEGYTLDQLTPHAQVIYLTETTTHITLDNQNLTFMPDTEPNTQLLDDLLQQVRSRYA